MSTAWLRAMPRRWLAITVLPMAYSRSSAVHPRGWLQLGSRRCCSAHAAPAPPLAARLGALGEGAHDAGLTFELELNDRLEQTRQRALELRGQVVDALGKEERKRLALAKEADLALKAEAMSAQAELIVTNLHAIDDKLSSGRALRVTNWAQLDAQGTPQQLTVVVPEGFDSARAWAEATFKKVRRMKRGSSAVVELVRASEQASERLVKLRETLDAAADAPERLLDAWPALEREATRAGIVAPAGGAAAAAQGGADRASGGSRPKVGAEGRAPTIGRGSSLREWGGRRFTSADGYQILVGRNRRENEALALSIAKHPDVWMHVRESPGAHVVLRLSKGARKLGPDAELPAEAMQMAANLAAFYSDMRNERRAPVSCASPKQLFKPRGAPLGAVGVRQELSSLVGFPHDVPDECKEARAQSGLSEFDDNFV